MASTINATAHGLVAGDTVRFTVVEPGTAYATVSGTDYPLEGTNWYVLASGLTADAFQFSTTAGGAAATLSEALTSLTVGRTDTYAADSGVQAPPNPVPTPTAPTVASALVSGIVRLQVTLNDTAEAKVRSWEVQVTHKFDASGNPDWTTPTKVTLPEGSTTLSIPALGATIYNVRVSATDVYGNVSSYSTATTHTTLSGSDSLAAALAALANDVSDGVITSVKIADGAISTPKLAAGAVTADILAATIVLSSLIKTANSGRRIEIDVDGIRLYDTDESLLVRIPTNGDPVYVKGQVTADSFISQTAATLRTTVSLEGNATMTLQNGVAAPTTAPTLVASVESLSLTTTPSLTSIGIAFDSAAGTYWIACDPSTGYVAAEYNKTTGALVRRISATGSTSTITATSGSTSHVSDTADGVVGSTNSHFTTPMVMPSPAGATNMKITKVSAYLAGRSGSAQCRVGVWNTSNVNLRESATFTASSGGATTLGASDHYDRSLSSALSVTAGTTYRVGFRHTDSTEGIQFDKDDGAGKTTYSGDGTAADGTGWGTYDSAGKPNVYFTYTYDLDTRLETSPMIGVATDGTYVYTLDTTGVVWKYDRTTGAYVSKSGVQTAISGAKANAGMFYDATAGELIITTATGTGAGVYPKFVRVTPSTLAVSSTVYSAAAGTTFNGTSDTFRGGARLADPLNASAATYWVATTSAVYAYTFSGTTATQTSNRDFGQAITVAQGLTYNSTDGMFVGFAIVTPTKLFRFTGWDWTTTSSTFWCGYAWRDGVGTTHETAMGPRASLTIRRRERLQVQNPAIPVGAAGVDDPNTVRIYSLQNATDTGAGTFWSQVTDALTSRYLLSYTGSGTHDGAGTAFPAGTPAEIKSAASGWSLKGDGTANFVDLVMTGVFTRPTISAHVIRASNLTVTGANVSTAVPFNATDDWDPYGWHDPAGANPSRILPGKAGKYRVRAGIHYGSMVATIPTRLIVELKVNGTSATLGGIAGTAQRLIEPNAQTFAQHFEGQWEVTLTNTDYIEIYVEHNSATSQTLQAADCTLEYMGT